MVSLLSLKWFKRILYSTILLQTSSSLSAANFTITAAEGGSDLAANEIGNVNSGGDLNVARNIAGTLNVNNGGTVSEALTVRGGGTINVNQGGSITNNIIDDNNTNNPINLNIAGSVINAAGAINLSTWVQASTITLDLSGTLLAATGNNAFVTANNANPTVVVNLNEGAAITGNVGPVGTTGAPKATLNVNASLIASDVHTFQNFGTAVVKNAGTVLEVTTNQLVEANGANDLRVGLDVREGAQLYLNGGNVGSANAVITSPMNGSVKIKRGNALTSGANALVLSNTGSLILESNDATNVFSIGTDNLTNNGAIEAIPVAGSTGQVALDVTNLPVNTGKYIHYVTGSANDNSSYLSIAGAADVSTSTIEMIPQYGVYITDGQTFQVIRGGAGATVAGVTLPGTLSLSYAGDANGNNVRVTATRIGYENLVSDSSSKGAGKTLNALSVNNAAIREISSNLDLETDKASLEDVFNEQILPERHGGSYRTSQEFVNQNAKLVADRLSVVRAENQYYVAGMPEADKGFWGKLSLVSIKQKKRKNVEGFKIGSHGVSVGFDKQISNAFLLGLGVGYSNSELDSLHFTKSHAKSESFLGMLYGGYDFGEYYADGSLIWSYNHYRRERNYSFGNFSKMAKSKNKGHQQGFNLDIGRVMDTDLNVTPLGLLRFVRSTQGEYTESVGGSPGLGQTVNNKAVNSLDVGVGVKLSKKINKNNVDILPSFSLRAMYGALRDAQESTVHYAADVSQSFQVKGPKPSNVGVGVSVGLLMKKHAKWNINLNYDLFVKNRYTAALGSLVIRYNW